MTIEEMREAIVRDIIAANDRDEIERAVWDYVDGFTDDTIREMYEIVVTP